MDTVRVISRDYPSVFVLAYPVILYTPDLVAILDWYSRCIIALELEQTLEQSFVNRAVDMALAQAGQAGG